jgi:hypothetical protein
VTDRIAKLKETVERTHHCKAIHIGSERVTETFQGEIAWDGVVEIFVAVLPEARRCYAWSSVERGEIQYTTVLEQHPVDSAKTAVQAAIAAQPRG